MIISKRGMSHLQILVVKILTICTLVWRLAWAKDQLVALSNKAAPPISEILEMVWVVVWPILLVLAILLVAFEAMNCLVDQLRGESK